MKLVYLMIISGCLFVSVATEYEVIQNVANWDIIKDRKMLASPAITVKGDKFVLKLEENMLYDDEKAWIGYVQDFQVFQYIGCVKDKDITENRQKIDYNPTDDLLGPGFCRSACMNSAMFGLGLEKTTCECFDTDLTAVIRVLTGWGCNKQCGESGIACGGNDYISLYQTADILMNVGSQPFAEKEKCLFYGGNLSWKTCDIKHQVVCMTDIGNVSSLNYKETWLHTAHRCFLNSIFPLNQKTLQTAMLSMSFWTAYIQTQTYIKLEGSMALTSYAKLGYVEKKGKEYYLKFTTNKTLTSTALSTKEASETMTTNGHTIRGGDDGDKVSLVGVYAGIPIGGILLILGSTVATLILCRNRLGVNVCFWKRDKNKHKYDDNREGDSVNQSSTARHNGLNHSNVNDNNLPNNYSSPYEDTNEVSVNEIDGANYYILEKKGLETLDYEDTEGRMNPHFTNVSKDQSEQSDSHVYNRIGATTAEGNPDVYDHIGNKPKVNETGLYNRLPENAEGDQTYDSTTTTNVTNTRGNDNDLYSHTATSNELPNNAGENTIYDSTASSRVTKNRHNDDEIYSKTNIDNDEYSTFQTASAGKTQNIYGYG